MIEEDIKGILGRLTLLESNVNHIWEGVNELNEKVDLLTNIHCELRK